MAQARIDNRAELLRAFGIASPDWDDTPDSTLIARAYERWGETCPDHLLGDWSFAVVDQHERTIFVARDQHGKTALYYSLDGNRFSFSSNRRALLALPRFSRKLNEDYLGKVLVGWPGLGGSQTVFSALHRLPPAHRLHVGAAGVQKVHYWRLDDVPRITLSSDDAYVEAFLEIFFEAVRCRLRGSRPIGVMLSGGLDSAAVAAVAARLLSERGSDPLIGFTAIPVAGAEGSLPPDRLTDEWALAHLVAESAGIVHVPIAAQRPTPIEGVRLSLECHGEPMRAAGHHYWHAALLEEAARRGLGPLLDGQSGNASISWSGPSGPGRWRNRLFWALPNGVRSRLLFRRLSGSWRSVNNPWRAFSPIQLEFAQRIQLAEQAMDSGFRLGSAPPTSGDRRVRLLQPGSAMFGAFSAEVGAAAGLEPRDPTADVRLLSFVFGIPEQQFQGPPSRWLIRRAMRGLLPDAVRLNERRGLQSADLTYRLRQHQAQTAETLDELDASPIVHEYLDLPRMREVSTLLLTQHDYHTTTVARTVLLRGIAAGLFLKSQTSSS